MTYAPINETEEIIPMLPDDICIYNGTARDFFLSDYMNSMLSTELGKLSLPKCFKAFAYPLCLTAVPTVCFTYACLAAQSMSPVWLLAVGGVLAGAYIIFTLWFYYCQKIPEEEVPQKAQSVKNQKNVVMYM